MGVQKIGKKLPKILVGKIKSRTFVMELGKRPIPQHFSTISTILKAMSKKEFLARRNEEKAAKKVAIAQSGINENYTAQSAEYKAFRCKVNRWQKECRDYFNAEYDLQFKGSFRFEVLSGTFKITEVGKVFMSKISEEDAADLKAEMQEMEEEFLAKVCNK